MKKIKLIMQVLGILFSVLIFPVGCHKVTVGYLETQNAIYIPDSMVVKSVLDEQEDIDRIRYQIPWQSTSIEGVQGTMPIRYSIRSIVGDRITPEVIEQFRMVRKGIVELPWDHSVPPGEYIINIRIANEGYTQDLDSVYRVIVQ